jgi:hypothetical protein
MPTNQEKFDWIYGELSKKYPSRSKYRTDNNLIDTFVGFGLNIDAMSHEALIERNALLGNKDAIALVKREADKGDTWSKLVYDKCPK